MPLHDCSKCESTDICPLVDIADWLNDHDKELEEVGESWRNMLAKACAHFVMEFPPAMLCPDGLSLLAKECFLIGYCASRRSQPIPKAFEEI